MWGRQERKKGPVRTLRHGLLIADRSVFLERDRNRALVVGQFLAVCSEQLERHAPFVLADVRLPACKLGGGAVVVGDRPVLIGRIDGDRKAVENLVIGAVLLPELGAGMFQLGDVDSEASGC